MAFELNIPLNNPDNLTFDVDAVETTLTGTLLKIGDNPGQLFIEDFNNDTGFVYDNTRTEFVGGTLRQKDQRPDNATFYVSYTSNLNGSWGDGVLTGSSFGGANLLNGELDLTFNDIRGVDYSAVLNADSPQTGCIRVKWRPNYSGFAPTKMHLITICIGDGVRTNLVSFSHDTNGQVAVEIRDENGAVIISTFLGVWNPTANNIYEFELNHDFTIGETRFFIEGQQLGITQTQTGIRDSNIGLLRIGSNYQKNAASDFKILDVVIFDTVQHTANYTPGGALEESIYLSDSVILPEMEYTGAETLVSFDAFLTTQGGTPKYTLQIGRSGNYLYWSGTAWITSDNTYLQANDYTTFANNVNSLPIEGEIYGQFKILFDDSNAQSFISELTASLTGQIYPVDNQRVDINASLNNEGILTFIGTEIKTGSDEIKYIISKGSTFYYWSGAVWAVSNGTYAESSTATDINDNLATFNPNNDNVSTSMSFFLHSETGQTTPENQNLFLSYDFFAGGAVLPNQCEVHGFLFNENNEPLNNVAITITPSPRNAVYGSGSVVCLDIIEVLTDIDGYWDVPLTETDNMPSVTYTFEFACACVVAGTCTQTKFKRKIPDLVSINFSELLQ